jgi:hypothetical protein
VAHAPEQVDFVALSEANRYSARPEPSVRKLFPLLVCTSTVVAAEAPAAAEDPGVTAELPDAAELQAVASTAAAASGTPTRTAKETFFGVTSLFISCAFPQWLNIEG